MRRLINLAGVVLWFVLLGLAFWGLVQVGSILPFPQAADVSPWLIDTPVAEIVLTILRAFCVLGVAYLVVASLVAVMVEVFRVETRLSLFNSNPVRRMLRAALGASVAVSSLASVSPAGALEVRDYPILHHVDPNARTTTTTTMAPSEGSVETHPTEPVVQDHNALVTHTVVSGDSLWSIATDVLSKDGSQPSHSEVAELVKRIADDNADVFADKANRDMIFPGQVFRLFEARRARGAEPGIGR